MGQNEREVEVKIRLADSGNIRRQILALGFTVLVERSLEDNWVLDFPDQILRSRRSLFRLREFAGKTILTYKAPSELSHQFKIREELETWIHDGPAFLRIMERLGMKITFRYQKFRTEFRVTGKSPYSGILLTFDETPIGDFLEIEGEEDGILGVAGALGFSPADFITSSYLALFLKQNPDTVEMRMVF
jgi:adenylate cyclase class 2